MRRIGGSNVTSWIYWTWVGRIRRRKATAAAAVSHRRHQRSCRSSTAASPSSSKNCLRTPKIPLLRTAWASCGWAGERPAASGELQLLRAPLALRHWNQDNEGPSARRAPST
uniref:Uncharacterized protein n=1 Tax=Arundo donax TaxID=35708 RepID=A0A0A9D2B7_ARUDO